MPRPVCALQWSPCADGTEQHILLPGGSLGPQGLPARKGLFKWAAFCWAAWHHHASAYMGPVGECVPWWMTSSSEAGTQEAYYGCNPCSEQPRIPGKDTKDQAGPSASQPGHALRLLLPLRTQGLPRPKDGSLAHLSTWSAHLLSPMQRPECTHLDSAAQHSWLPFLPTFQKYHSHTVPARAAEKTMGSAARKRTQATPAQPEIPPSPVALPRDPISPRCPGWLW